MKAPDKIYLIPFGKPIKEPYPDDDGTTIWSSNPFGNTNAGNIEYIRKDAILEWAKEQKKATEELIKEHPKDDSLWAEMHWYEQLIKHIESL